MRNGLFKRYYSTKNSSKRWSQTVTIPKSDLPNRRTPKSETDFLEVCFQMISQLEELIVVDDQINYFLLFTFFFLLEILF